MSSSKCPLGEDCDLTVAYMAGMYDAKKQYAEEIERLREALRKIIKVKPRYGAEADDMLEIAEAALKEKE